MQKTNFVVFILGIVGLLIGGYIGFLMRPAVPMFGQIPFEYVISMGSQFKGMDEILIPIAQKSFFMTIGGSFIGFIIGVIVGFLIKNKTSTSEPIEK